MQALIQIRDFDYVMMILDLSLKWLLTEVQMLRLHTVCPKLISNPETRHRGLKFFHPQLS